MRTFSRNVVKFLHEEDGPTAVEYAVMLALIIVFCLAAIQSLGKFKDQRAVSALKAAYDQANNTAASEIQQAGYQPARGFLPETAAALRCHALAALGQTQNPAAVDLLVRVVRQPPSEGTEEDRQEEHRERLHAITQELDRAWETLRRRAERRAR